MTSIKTPLHARWLLLAILLLLMLSVPVLAAPGNPLAGITVSGSENKDLGKMIGFFIKLFITAIPFVVIIMNFSEAILSVFAALRDAIRNNAYGTFFFILMFIFIGVGVTVFLGYLMFELLGKFDSFWSSGNSSTPTQGP